MTPQDSRLLQDFLDQLARTQAGAKDPEAQDLINRTFARQPDAAYLLVQRAVLLEQALKQAQAQIAQLQQQSPPPAPGYAPAQAMPPAPQPTSPWGSFLGNAAATAAGVAGGAMLFQGLGHLFGHEGQSAGAGMPGESIENVTVNNYGSDHDSAKPAADDSAGDSADPFDGDDSDDYGADAA
jgi:hypothetical protein